MIISNKEKLEELNSEKFAPQIKQLGKSFEDLQLKISEVKNDIEELKKIKNQIGKDNLDKNS